MSSTLTATVASRLTLSTSRRFTNNGQDPNRDAHQHEIPLTEGRTLRTDPDEFLVSWDNDSDPEDPKNWNKTRKWSVTLTMSGIGFVAILSSSVVAPALSNIAGDLHMSPIEAQMGMSIYVLGLAVSPLILGPLSEMIGRLPVIHATNAWFLIWTLAGGFARNKATMIAARYFAGIGGSLVYAVGAGVMGDVWRPQQRGRSLGLYSAVPLLGTAVGPLIGGLATQELSWRWIFYIVGILQATVMITSIWTYEETYPPILLARKARAMRESSGNQQWHSLSTFYEERATAHILHNLSRPIRLLLLNPVLQITTFYKAFDYGILYLVLSTFATVWQERYGQSLTTSGLNYIAFVVGELTAASIGAVLTDRIWKRLSEKRSNNAEPEFRVPLMLPGALIMASGLLMYGWSAQARSFWLVLDIGVGMVGCGLLLVSQAVQAYTIDAFPDHVNSASSASQLLSSIFAFAFPLFGPKLYDVLGFGWGNTLLGCMEICFGLLFPGLIWRFGATMRRKARAVE